MFKVPPRLLIATTRGNGCRDWHSAIWRLIDSFNPADNSELVRQWLRQCPVAPSTTVHHYNDVIMGAMASQITSLPTVYSTVYSCINQRKHQRSPSLALWGNSPVTGEFPALSNAENVSIWWRHHATPYIRTPGTPFCLFCFWFYIL